MTVACILLWAQEKAIEIMADTDIIGKEIPPTEEIQPSLMSQKSMQPAHGNKVKSQ